MMTEVATLMSRNEVAAALHRKPRYVTERLFRPRVLSFVKMGREYFVKRSDFNKFVDCIRKCGRIS